MRVLLIITLFLMSCSSHVPEMGKEGGAAVANQRKEFQVIIPKATWEPIYFEAINERASIANLPSLRSAALPKDDLEARIWIGFGLTALRGFRLKRSAGEWAGTYIQGIPQRLTRGEYQKGLQAPKSGWNRCWLRLVDRGILTLPDARSIACESGALDGVSYVVETNMDRTYRTYMYDNPQFASCKEAKQIIEIANILDDEFGQQLPRY